MDYIKISGYKSIRELNFTVCPINILIGANGAGKSNFISFFKFLNAIYEKNLSSYVALNGGMNKFLFKGRKETQSIGCDISFKGGKNRYCITLSAGEESFVVSNEALYYYDRPWYIPSHLTEAQVSSETSPRADYIQRYLLGLKVYHFHDVGKDSPFNSSSLVTDSVTLSSKGENLSSVLFRIKEDEPKQYRRIVETVQIVAPYFSDFVLEPDANDEYVRLRWKEKGNEIVYGASDFSDGTMRFVALVTLFMQTKLPKTIIIDEPELGLHPVAINVLSSLIKSAARQGTQVIVATQSVELINEFEPKDIIVVDRMGGASVFARLSGDELSGWLDDYTVGTLWVKNIINKGQPSR